MAGLAPAAAEAGGPCQVRARRGSIAQKNTRPRSQSARLVAEFTIRSRIISLSITAPSPVADSQTRNRSLSSQAACSPGVLKAPASPESVAEPLVAVGGTSPIRARRERRQPGEPLFEADAASSARPAVTAPSLNAPARAPSTRRAALEPVKGPTMRHPVKARCWTG